MDDGCFSLYVSGPHKFFSVSTPRTRSYWSSLVPLAVGVPAVQHAAVAHPLSPPSTALWRGYFVRPASYRRKL